MRVAVSHADDVALIRCDARTYGELLGFCAEERSEVAIVASELASNVVKYGVSGHVEILPVRSGERVIGVKIDGWDVGPPFHDFDLACLDGHDDLGRIDPATMSTRKGFGGGLGAVRRLCESVRLEQNGSAKCVSALWLRYAVGKRVEERRYARASGDQR